MTVAGINYEGLWLAAPLAALSIGFGTAEAIILNRRLRIHPHGRELRWACSALFALAMIAMWIPVGFAYAWIVAGALPLVRLSVTQLRAEWRDPRREFFA